MHQFYFVVVHQELWDPRMLQAVGHNCLFWLEPGAGDRIWKLSLRLRQTVVRAFIFTLH